MLSLAVLLSVAPRSDAPRAATLGGDAFAEGLQAYDGGMYTEAREHWHTAAMAGHVDAMTSLADLMMRGQGGRLDRASAVVWYRRAARSGDATASLALGEVALGSPDDQIHDTMAAFVWFSISARQGNTWAKERAVLLRRTLSGSEHAMADRIINENTLPKF